MRAVSMGARALLSTHRHHAHTQPTAAPHSQPHTP
jgi:hypothetical protein